MTVVVVVCLFVPSRKNRSYMDIDIYKEETIKMSVQVENLEKNMAKLTIEVPAEELEKALAGSYTRNRRNRSAFRDSVKEKFREL